LDAPSAHRTSANDPGAGGTRELMVLALPLILSSSLWTLQITIDRVLLSWYSTDAVGAATQAVFVFWTAIILFQNTCSFATTFVAQYVGAGRPHRVGPVVWQAIHFAIFSGLAFLLFIPLAGPIFSLADHSETMQEMERTYFICVCWSALPTLIVAAASSFFAGRGDSWTVMGINAVGLAVNAVLDYWWIGGGLGLPAYGVAGAGWATVAGQWASAFVALGLMLRRRFRQEYATHQGWRIEWPLLSRLVRFGFPAGIQWMFDALAWTVFLFFIGQLGPVEQNATGVTFTINMVAILPLLGIGQAVSILVGQRLGEDRPELAERSTWTGFRVAWLYMAGMGAIYLFFPQLFVGIFANDAELGRWSEVEAMSIGLLRFVSIYCLIDSINMVFSFALRGAGDTRFVTWVTVGLAGPMLVLPAWACWYYGWGVYWAWGFATAYIFALAATFLLRFRTGKWKTMRVIEPAVMDIDLALPAAVVSSAGNPGLAALPPASDLSCASLSAPDAESSSA
jgi:MATE family multidrug resistance protein